MTPYGATYVSGLNFVTSVFPVEMRAAPTVAANSIRWSWQGSSVAVTGISVDQAGTKTCGLSTTTGGGETGYRPGVIIADNTTSAYLTFSAEL
jgi:hypothetical protein